MSGTVRVAADAAAIAWAGGILAHGGLIAFPTETVYGLGANALDPAAVRRIFEAKGRPAWNPLIVHVADVAQARALAAHWPEAAERLATVFWPGPLSIVVPRGPVVPDIVTGGLDAVALRMPAHPVALGIIRAAGVPIAAPSANRFTELSPTTADHVVQGLDGRIDAVVDGGPTTVGIESTVVDLTIAVPTILRPGMITCAQMEAVLGAAMIVHKEAVADGEARPSPGMVARHYAPRGRVRVVVPDAVLEAITVARAEGCRVGALVCSAADAGDVCIRLPDNADGYALGLYAALHQFDAVGCDVIVVEAVPADPAWQGIRDRLRRAGEG
jgi:L-threonylcarbamoyladenylate synthase